MATRCTGTTECLPWRPSNFGVEFGRAGGVVCQCLGGYGGDGKCLVWVALTRSPKSFLIGGWAWRRPENDGSSRVGTFHQGVRCHENTTDDGGDSPGPVDGPYGTGEGR